MLKEMLDKVKWVGWFMPGFLLWAAFPPMGECTDVLFALAPLMWLSRREVDARVSAKRWFQSGIFYWAATLSWMPAIIKNGGPWPLVVLGWFGLAAYCSLYFAAYGFLACKIWRWAREGGAYWRRLLAILVLEPVLWCGLELVRSRFGGGFAWNQLGVTAVNCGLGAPAAFGGVYLCSAVIILINGTIAGIVERMWRAERSGFANLRRLGPVETLLAFVVVMGIYSQCKLTPAEDHERETLKVAMIQRNFPCCFQDKEESPYPIYEKLLENVSGLKPELVVLPESAMCEFGPVGQQGACRFAQWVSTKTGGAVLAGGTRFEDGKTYNSAALYQGNSVVAYDKVHLVPFGEFIPGDKWLPALQKLAPVGSCTPGELKLLELETAEGKIVRLGVGICFEDTDSAQIRELAAKGARALVFITNDSWFSHSHETVQHAWQATARAVETGLSVIRVGNSGVTGTISPDGRASWLMGTNGKPMTDRRGTMFDKVALATEQADSVRRTPYVRLGDWPLGIAFAVLLLSMAIATIILSVTERN